MADNKIKATVSILKPVLIYVVFSCLWIVFSDKLVMRLFSDPGQIAFANTSKGWLFVAITSALLFLLLKSRRTHPETSSPEQNTANVTSQKNRLVLLFIALALVIPLIGALFVKLQTPQIEQAAFNNLQAIAQLKATQIENWLNERSGDANILAAETGLAAKINSQLQGKAAPQTTQEIVSRFQSLIDSYAVNSVLLIDNHGHLALSLGKHLDMPPATQNLVSLSISTKQVQRSQLFRDESGNVHIDWVVPIVIHDAQDKPAVAAVIIRHLASQFLYPLIQMSASASASAETLLVRREGESILYLNNLRHRQDTALTTKLPSSKSPSFVAINAAQSGTTRGKDYRDTEILAAYRPIANTDWHLVTKIDRDEVLLPLWDTSFWIGLIAFAAVSSLMLSLLLFWQQQKRMQVLALAAQQNKTDQLFSYFYDLPFIGMSITSPESKYWLKVNDFLCDIFGYSKEELLTKSWVEMTHPDDLNADLVQFEQVLRNKLNGYTMEKRFIRKDGVAIDTRLNVKCIRKQDGSVDFFIATIDDISERKQSEAIQAFLANVSGRSSDESFFYSLARFLGNLLDMEFVCIDRLEGDGLTARTLAVWSDGNFQDNLTYALKDTPCGQVVGQTICCYPENVCQLFPHDQFLQDLNAESYVGVTLWSSTGQPIGLLVVIGRRPITNRLKTEAAIKQVVTRAAGELERRLAETKLKLAASVFSHAREGILISDADAKVIDVNDSFTRITGYPHHEIVGKNPSILKSGLQDNNFYAAMWKDLKAQGHWAGEIWNRRKNGEIYAEILNISAVRDAEGTTEHYVAVFSDISSSKKHEQQLEHIAHYDALTNLPNRVLLADRLRHAMTQAQRRGQKVAAAFLDLDGFKAINDTHGHDAGDQLLITVATRMRQTLRESDTLARLGGDEFVAVLVDLDNLDDSVPMLSRLLAAAAQPVQFGDISLQVSASLGVSFYPQAEDIDADQLLRQADQAMYQAKLAGKNRYHIFDTEQDSSIRGHHESLDRIRRALIEDEFVLFYQPKVNMRTGKVIGAEALIRWQHPDKGLLPPALFLPMIEDHPLAVDIGEWVIDTALEQIEQWQALGLDLPISVNIGARQLQQTDFASRLQTLLAAHPNVSPTYLEIELLETSALEDLAHISQILHACRELGVKYALDDFGTGYSSLTYLKRLPVTMLKIDQSFVRDMLDDPEDLAIIEGVVGLAAAFHRQVIAEGVETVEHGSLLLQFGCELAQGYGIARPMPASAMCAWAAGWQPEAVWATLLPVKKEDLALLYTSVELRALVVTLENHLNGKSTAAPKMRCYFSQWLDSEGLAYREQPSIKAIEMLHKQVYELSTNILELQAQGKNHEALLKLNELPPLTDDFLKQLQPLLQKN